MYGDRCVAPSAPRHDTARTVGFGAKNATGDPKPQVFNLGFGAKNATGDPKPQMPKLETDTMRKVTSALLLLAFATMGCAKEKTDEGSVATSEGAIGIAECDAYVEKMEAFLDTLPSESRSAREPGFKAMRAAWREAAQSASAKDNLAATCKSQLATLPPGKPAQ